MRAQLVGFLATVLLLATATASEALVCTTSTVFGNYVFTLAGINAVGHAVSNLATATFSNADANGNGTLTGTIFVNENGESRNTLGLSGDYHISTNCFITIHIQEPIRNTVRFDALTGFVAQGGALIIFSSPFDAGAQFTGVATQVPF